MWGACKGKGKDGWGGAKGGPYGGGKGDGWGGMDPYEATMMKMAAMIAAKGGAFGGKGGGGGDGGGAAAWGGKGGGEAPVRSVRQPKKPANPAFSWKGEIPGFNDALTEAFEAAGIDKADTDMEDVFQKIDFMVRKQAKKFYNDERAGEKMSGAYARSFMGEFVEAAMSGISTTLYEKDWFDKVSWNGVLLMVVFWAFESSKVFGRIMKSQVMAFIDDGILAWSEEERISRAMWTAVEAANFNSDKQVKKANSHLTASYDEAHFRAEFGAATSDSLNAELAELQAFVKGWMKIFANKGWQILENNLEDNSVGGQSAALTTIFQHLLDPSNACLPLSLQGHLPQESAWPYIEQCSNEVIAELHAPRPPKEPKEEATEEKVD